MASVTNHVGLAVADIGRSRTFYEGVFGFEFRNEMSVPDAATSRLMAIAPPLGMRAVYLYLGDWVLELLAYDDAGLVEGRVRPLNEPGLTHLSISVDDVDAAIASAVTLGGTHEPARGFKGMVEMIRDPDGQLIELLPMTYRDSL